MKILEDPIFFYGVAYVLFLVVAWIFARKPALDWVDGEVSKIRNELDQVRRLRAEAETALRDAMARKAQAAAEAGAIVEHAKAEARRLAVEGEANLKSLLARHERHALERIRYMEEDAVAQVRTAAVDMAMDLVRKTLAEHMDESVLTKLADQAISDMPKLVAAKAKAA